VARLSVALPDADSNAEYHASMRASVTIGAAAGGRLASTR
jgi:hypothetical protein